MSSIVNKLKHFWLGPEDSFEDDFDQLFKLNSPAQAASSHASAPTRHPEKQDMLSPATAPLPASSNKSAALPSNFKLLDTSGGYSATNEVIVLEPTSFNQAVDIIQYLKKGASIVLNLGKLEPEHSQRLLDFVCGGIYALDGSQKRVGDGVFLLVPSSVNINAVNADHNTKVNQFWGSKESL